ncbi:MAG: hypothetical protein JWR74_332, partial [Polaromonas sp.]|nr:hypothetical protein [Polaromonas sp.]
MSTTIERLAKGANVPAEELAKEIRPVALEFSEVMFAALDKNLDACKKAGLSPAARAMPVSISVATAGLVFLLRR